MKVQARKTNKMHLFLINLLQLKFPVHVFELKKFIICRLFLYTQRTEFPVHLWWCLAPNTIRLEL